MTELIVAIVAFIGGAAVMAWRLRGGRPLRDLAKAILNGAGGAAP